MYLSLFRCYSYIILKVRLSPRCQNFLHNLEMTPEWAPHQGWEIILQWKLSDRGSWPSTLECIWVQCGIQRNQTVHQILYALNLHALPIMGLLFTSDLEGIRWCSKFTKGFSASNLLHQKWKEKNSNEWINEKPQKCMCIYSISFPVWEDLLKFDTTAWNSYWSTYCHTFAINELHLWWHRILKWSN